MRASADDPGRVVRRPVDIDSASTISPAWAVIVDIGAGYGEEALPLSRIVGATGRILSFEAHPRAYRGLLLMCELNDLDNVEPYNVAVMADEGTLHISDDDPISKGNTVIGQTGGIYVEATRSTASCRPGLTERSRKRNIEGPSPGAEDGSCAEGYSTHFGECTRPGRARVGQIAQSPRAALPRVERLRVRNRPAPPVMTTRSTASTPGSARAAARATLLLSPGLKETHGRRRQLAPC